jgi:hypothetical protein
MKHVPSVVELVGMGLAKPMSRTKDGDASTFSISPAGHALLGEIMRSNALEARAAGSADWVRPPNSGNPLPH